MVDGKPFVVSRSDHRRFVVECSDPACDFILSFYRSDDGLFRIHFDVDHSCDLYVPNIKRRWLLEKVRFLMSTRTTITPREVIDWVHEKYGFYPQDNIVRRVICDARKGGFGDKQPFGTIASFFDELKRVNDRSTTDLRVVEVVSSAPFSLSESASGPLHTRPV